MSGSAAGPFSGIFKEQGIITATAGGGTISGSHFTIGSTSGTVTGTIGSTGPGQVDCSHLNADINITTADTVKINGVSGFGLTRVNIQGSLNGRVPAFTESFG